MNSSLRGITQDVYLNLWLLIEVKTSKQPYPGYESLPAHICPRREHILVLVQNHGPGLTVPAMCIFKNLLLHLQAQSISQ